MPNQYLGVDVVLENASNRAFGAAVGILTRDPALQGKPGLSENHGSDPNQQTDDIEIFFSLQNQPSFGSFADPGTLAFSREVRRKQCVGKRQVQFPAKH